MCEDGSYFILNQNKSVELVYRVTHFVEKEVVRANIQTNKQQRTWDDK